MVARPCGGDLGGDARVLAQGGAGEQGLLAHTALRVALRARGMGWVGLEHLSRKC